MILILQTLNIEFLIEMIVFRRKYYALYIVYRNNYE